jgi:hypothetical protein
MIFMCEPHSAFAGPPFLTDDPEPTETGHWEIYAPLMEGEGRGADFEGTVGTELNYGAAPDLQLSLSLPVAYSHDARGWRWGAGDIEVSAKYRFFHNEDAGLSVAAFPRATLPTGGGGLSTGKVSALLPIWAQKNAGPWSIFGGGGFAINPGAGNRNYWTGGIAVTRTFTERLLLGVEVDRQGADKEGQTGSTRVGLGAIIELRPPLRLLASGGPTFDDAGGSAGFHGFVAVGMDF